MRQDFIAAIRSNENEFGCELDDKTIERLADYYELVERDNPILHLVAPCTPQEFATRHVLESLTALQYLPANARFADVGTGAGLPGIPCLLARQDLSGVLIESKQKKVKFLEGAVSELGLQDRATIIGKQFTEADRPDVSFVTCRALDRFAENLSRLLKWSSGRTLLFFGGPALLEELQRRGCRPQKLRMPLSERRYLFIVEAGWARV